MSGISNNLLIVNITTCSCWYYYIRESGCLFYSFFFCWYMMMTDSRWMAIYGQFALFHGTRIFGPISSVRNSEISIILLYKYSIIVLAYSFWWYSLGVHIMVSVILTHVVFITESITWHVSSLLRVYVLSSLVHVLFDLNTRCPRQNNFQKPY